MAKESKKDVAIAEKSDMPVHEKKQRQLVSWIWNGLFGSHNDDFERTLERISKEEATILSIMRIRRHNWLRLKWHLIFFSVLLELIAVGYAMMTKASAENWKIRALRVLPIFLLLALSFVVYTAIKNFIKMCE